VPATRPALAFALLAFAVFALVAFAGASGGAVSGVSDGVAAGGSGGAADSDASADARIVAVYPNPVADGDRGEFVVAWFPDLTDLRGWTLHDGETAAALPNRTVSGTVAFATHPDAARDRTPHPVVALDAPLELSNAGERVELRRDGRAVDALAYGSAPEAEVWTRDGWRPLGATDHAPAVERGVPVRAFALPDAPGVPDGVLRSADRRLYLAGYTFSSARAADALAAAARRGVDVRVLVEGGPVGGVTRREARLLDRLARAGVEVRAVAGPYARYDFHHAKYAVADDRALVTSENWKPSGTGGRANRGWGVVVRDAELADRLARVFRADAGWRAAVEWQRYRANQTFQSATASTGSYPARFRPRRFRADAVHLVVAPDNAESRVVSLVRSADRSVAVQQVSVEPGSPFLRAAVAAARRGVRVRVLLSGAWYVREDNRKLVGRLRNLSAREGLPLDASLVEPRSRFEKVHVKGVVVDRRRVYVGSLNWNNHSARENRELGVILAGGEVGRYYARVFRADWRGGAWRVPAGVLAAVVGAVTAAGVVGRSWVRFASEA
jgi:phosphatidylserine/phosphatidylglycerophosphate/cardiolipin synthase-like enzyme